jgi:hypothetical protein
VRPQDVKFFEEMEAKLQSYSVGVKPLPGISTSVRRNTFIKQIIESVRRVKYVEVLRDQGEFDPLRKDPTSELFDPLKAAILLHREGNIDEAMWMVFLSTHCSKHISDGWQLTKELYGGLGDKIWSWHKVGASPEAFAEWLEEKRHNIVGRFGNHRKYSSLDTTAKTNNTALAIKTYVQWVGPNRGHGMLFQRAQEIAGKCPYQGFDYLYNQMDVVHSFARLGKFDFLTMVGKLGFANIEPGSPYLVGSSGPLKGARLLFENPTNAVELNEHTTHLGRTLGLGMQVMEDSLCNWQKSPEEFISFRG